LQSFDNGSAIHNFYCISWLKEGRRKERRKERKKKEGIPAIPLLCVCVGVCVYVIFKVVRGFS
jgi:hypothetical protein